MTFNIAEPHALSVAQAALRLRRFVSVLKLRWGAQVQTATETWEGDRCVYRIVGVRGRVITGEITVGPTQAVVTANCSHVPFLLRGWIESEIRQSLQRALQGV